MAHDDNACCEAGTEDQDGQDDASGCFHARGRCTKCAFGLPLPVAHRGQSRWGQSRLTLTPMTLTPLTLTPLNLTPLTLTPLTLTPIRRGCRGVGRVTVWAQGRRACGQAARRVGRR